MAQILVFTDAPGASAELVFSEHLDPIHLDSRHSGDQLLERLAWAVRDAQQAERRSALRVVRRRAREPRAA
jgi:hypothetical protein